MQKGYGGEIVDIPAEGKVFTVEYENYWDIFIAPADGYRVSSITGVDGKGLAIEKENAGWTYDSKTFTYTIYSSNYGTNLNGYQFKVQTETYVAPKWDINVNINNVEALSGGQFSVGIQTVKAVNGDNKVSINPDQGKGFEATLTPSVQTATLTLNGTTVVPDTTYDGRLRYRFDLEGNSNIVLNATMENPVCYIECDDPAHMTAYYPDAETVYPLKAGRQELTYTVGSTLAVYPAEGYKLVCSDNMSYDQSTKSYSVRFTGGQSGQTYKIESQVYVAPIAHITLNLTDADLVTYVGFTPGYNPHRSFEKGDNYYEYNLEDVNMMEVDYNAETEDEIIAACNDTVLAIGKDFYGDLCSEIALTTPGEYWIAVRPRLTGDWSGEATWLECDTTIGDFKANYIVSFNPGGVLENANAEANVELLGTAGKVADVNARMHHGDLLLYVDKEDLKAGVYTVSIPAGMWRVNGASLSAATRSFEVEDVSVGSIGIDANTADMPVYSIDGRIVAPAANEEAIRALAPGLYIIGGKKMIIK